MTDIDVSNGIGIFDSGVGGLSIYQGIKQLLPNERVMYIGDTAHSPYGEKSTAFILQRCRIICQYLQLCGVKAIVVACNTATVSVIKRLREEFSLPIIGVEPAVKPAALNSQTGHVAVFATRATIASESFHQLMAQYHHNAQFHTVACRGLVEAIENQPQESAVIDSLLNDFIHQISEYDIDALVLGCTHYPFVKREISAMLPAHVRIYDTAEAVARQLQYRLQQANAETPEAQGQTDLFFTTGNALRAEPLFSALLNNSTTVKQITI